MWTYQRYCWQLQNHVWILNFRRSTWKNTVLGKFAYLFVVLWHGRPCQEMCGTILWVGEQDDSTTLQSVNSMHWRPSFQGRRIEIRGVLSKVCSLIFLKCLYLARNGRLDILWSVNKLARSITKWTKACDKRLSRLISYIHHTREYKQYCYVGNTAKQCRLGLFQDSDFAGDLEDSKSTSGGTLCIFWKVIHLFQSVGFVKKNKLQLRTVQQNQKSFPWTQDWGWTVYPHLIYGIWSSQFFKETRIRVIKKERGDLCMNLVRVAPHRFQTRKKSNGMIDDLDFIFFKRALFQSGSFVVFFEDNEAVIKMFIKGRSPSMRHVSRTHRVALGWLFDRINSDPKIQITYIDTKNQLGDTLTKGNFTRDEWNHLLCLFNVSHFSSSDCIEVMSKRTQEDAGDERVTAKSKPMMNLVSRCSVRDHNVLASTASESPVKTRSQSQIPLSSWNEQQPRTERPVMGASSSHYSEWNIDEKWSSHEWKSDEILEARTVRPVGGQQFTQHTDKFVIDDDDMDSDTATESDLSFESRSFLHRVNDRLRKILDHSSKDAMQDIDKHSLIWWVFMSSTLEASEFMGKNYSENLHSIKNTGNNLTLKQMFDIFEKLIVGTIRWDFWSDSN